MTRPRRAALAGGNPPIHALPMFVISEAEAAAIRAIFRQRGEFSAAVELRRLVSWYHGQCAGAGVRADDR